MDFEKLPKTRLTMGRSEELGATIRLLDEDDNLHVMDYHPMTCEHLERELCIFRKYRRGGLQFVIVPTHEFNSWTEGDLEEFKKQHVL